MISLLEQYVNNVVLNLLGTVKYKPNVPSARGSNSGRTLLAPTGTSEWVRRGDGGCHAAVGRDAFAVLPPAKPALRAASRSEVQDIAPRYEGGTVKTVPYSAVLSGFWLLASGF